MLDNSSSVAACTTTTLAEWPGKGIGNHPGRSLTGRRRGQGRVPLEPADQAVLSFITEARTPVLTNAAKVAVLPTTFVAVMALRLGTVVVLVVYGRFRHLVVFLATLVVTDWIVVRLLFVELPRPEVPALVEVDAYAFPSKAISTLAITLFAMAFVLLPRGGTRNRLRAGAVAVLALVVPAELYLAGDHLSAMLYAAVLAPAWRP